MFLESRLGQHIILDIWGADGLTEIEHIEKAFAAMAEAASATLLKMQFHHFGEGCGITGVALLAESHISIHSWPEYNYAAIDIFMCGDSDIQRAIPVVKEYFTPASMQVTHLSRGVGAKPAPDVTPA